MLTKTLQGKRAAGSLICQNLVFWCGFCLNVILCSTFVAFIYFDKFPEYTEAVLPIIYLTGSLFFIDGLRRIKKVMAQLSDQVVVFEAFMLHSLAFLSFFIGQIPNIIIGFTQGD